VEGQRLYELAHKGIEIEREPKLCHLYDFEFLDYTAPDARFRVSCSSGTYIRTLAQDFSRLLGSVGMLRSLHRTGSGCFSIENAMSAEQISQKIHSGAKWDELDCF